MLTEIEAQVRGVGGGAVFGEELKLVGECEGRGGRCFEEQIIKGVAITVGIAFARVVNGMEAMAGGQQTGDGIKAIGGFTDKARGAVFFHGENAESVGGGCFFSFGIALGTNAANEHFAATLAGWKILNG